MGVLHIEASLNLLVEQTNFAFYSIKIRLETGEILATLDTWLRKYGDTDLRTLGF